MSYGTARAVHRDHHRPLALTVVLLLTAALVVAITPTAAHAATITVDTFDDITTIPDPDNCNGGAGDCTLREAVALANEDAAPATIELPEGTYELTAAAEIGGLFVNEDLSIVGLGDGATIEMAVGGPRIVTVNAASLTLDTLTLTGADTSGLEGESGAALWFRGDAGDELRIHDSTIRDNTAWDTAGVWADGYDLVEVIGSTFTGNESEGGSAISLQAWDPAEDAPIPDTDVHIENTTITGNVDGEAGSTVFIGLGQQSHEEFDLFTGEVRIVNSTIADNSTGEGLHAVGAEFQPAGRGLTVGNGADAQLANTILSGHGIEDCNTFAEGTFTSLGGNIIGDDSCGFDDADDQPETDPQLQPLADNDGPTLTRAIDEGSPAFEAAVAEHCPDVDQRGVDRKTPCDVGAFELVEDAPDPDPEPEPFTLEECLESFVDVGPDHTHAVGICVLTREGITLGFTDATYRPDIATSRAQLASFVARAMGLEADAAPTFGDVGENHTHARGIAATAEAGIIEGFLDGTFRPDTAVSRAQAASILARALHAMAQDDPPFSDVTGDHPHAAGIAAMAEAEIVLGWPDGTFRPARDVTRGQAASMIVRAFDLPMPVDAD